MLYLVEIVKITHATCAVFELQTGITPLIEEAASSAMFGVIEIVFSSASQTFVCSDTLQAVIIGSAAYETFSSIEIELFSTASCAFSIGGALRAVGQRSAAIAFFTGGVEVKSIETSSAGGVVFAYSAVGHATDTVVPRWQCFMINEVPIFAGIALICFATGFAIGYTTGIACVGFVIIEVSFLARITF